MACRLSDSNSDSPKANIYCLGDPSFHSYETPIRNRFHKIMYWCFVVGKNYDFWRFVFVIWIVRGDRVAMRRGVKTFQTPGVLGRLR